MMERVVLVCTCGGQIRVSLNTREVHARQALDRFEKLHRACVKKAQATPPTTEGATA